MKDVFILEEATWLLFVGTHPPPPTPLPTAYGTNPNKNFLGGHPKNGLIPNLNDLHPKA